MARYLNPHPEGCPWHQITETWGAANIKWCETTLCSWISEPANTWSNLIYFFISFLIFKKAWSKNSATEMWAACSMFLMGFFSFYYHMSNYYISQMLDFFGMYLFLMWYLTIQIKILKNLSTSKTILIYIFLLFMFMLATFYGYQSGFYFQFLVVIAGAMIIVCEYNLYKQNLRPESYKTLFYGMVFIAIAQTFSFADLTRVFCIPNNHLLPGHAVWHFFSALGLYFAYLHQRALKIANP